MLLAQLAPKHAPSWGRQFAGRRGLKWPAPRTVPPSELRSRKPFFEAASHPEDWEVHILSPPKLGGSYLKPSRDANSANQGDRSLAPGDFRETSWLYKLCNGHPALSLYLRNACLAPIPRRSPPNVGEDLLEGDPLKFATTTRFVDCGIPNLRARFAVCY